MFCFITFYSYLDVYQYNWYPHVYILHYFHIYSVILEPNVGAHKVFM